MKQHISTFMDGELFGDEAEVLLGKIKRHPDARQEWLDYHLIGDVLRQPDYVFRDMDAAFFERLQAEPTMLAPHSQRSNKSKVIAMSAVASVMAMAFLTWISMQVDSGPVYRQAMQGSNGVRTVSFPANEEVNDYLLAHQEFSPGTDVRGAASYIRTVSLQNAVVEK